MYVFWFFPSSVLGPVEADPEYQLIVESNNMIVEIDNEISKVVIRVTCTCICVLIHFYWSNTDLSFIYY